MGNYIYSNHRKIGLRPRRLNNFLILGLAIIIALELLLLVTGLMGASKNNASNRGPLVEVINTTFLQKIESPPSNQAAINKRELVSLVGPNPSLDITEKPIWEISGPHGRPLFARTTILPSLQNQADKWVNSSGGHQAAVVVIDPDTGEVLALSGYRDEGQGNAALESSFPAASLFKIITAAAAVETAEMSADSQLAYDGRSHTLYKTQLATEPDEGQQAITLRSSFAESINSVFGKLGIHTLGAEKLTDFATRFGFNQTIDFELPVEESNFTVNTEDDFHLAELASGFNRSTTVSPLHGALIAAAIVADGKIRRPSLVREVFDQDNKIYYSSQEEGHSVEVISPRVAQELQRMMTAAVKTGTARKTFQNAAQDPILSRLIIGGKSGTLNNDKGQRVDWFVAWAKPGPNNSGRRLAVSAVVVHSGVFNTTSQRLVRQALTSFYRQNLTSKPNLGSAKSTTARQQS